MERADVAGVVLAAGGSARFGDDLKQLAGFDGEKLVHRAARTALEAGLAPVLVVVGCRGDQVAAAVADLPVEIVENPGWQAGQSRSVLAGLAALPAGAHAAIFLACDQPLLDPLTLERLRATWRKTGAAAVAPVFGERRGSPVLFARELFGELAGIAGDEGGRQVLGRHVGRIAHVELEREDPLLDVDTPAELAALARRD